MMASYLMEFPIAFGTKKQEEKQENATKTRKQQQPFCNFHVFFIFDTFTIYTTPGNVKKNIKSSNLWTPHDESFIWQTPPALPVPPKPDELQRQVAPKNDAVIISTVASLMEDRHTGVCCSAVQVGIWVGWRTGSVKRGPRVFLFTGVFRFSGGRGRYTTLETGRKSV